MERKLKQRICIEFCVKLQISATKTFEMLNKAFPNDAPKRTTVFEWHSRFKAGRISIEDAPRQGRPKFQSTDENVQKITDLIKENPRTTLLELEQDTGISKTTIGRIVTEGLKLKKTPAKFIPRFLTNEQKLCRLATCEDMMEMTRTDPEWKDKIITGDETWVYGYDPETKPQSADWRGQTVIKEMYLGILRRLREAIRKKRPEKWTNGGWILHHDNARPHTAHLMTSFLAKNGTQILLQPPYFPDIAPNDFFLFPKLKAVLKGRHFDTRDDIIEKSPLALKNIPKVAYKNCFDNWEKRWRCSDFILWVPYHFILLIPSTRGTGHANHGGADTPRKSYKQRLVDGTTSKKIPRAESRGRKDVEENPTSRVSWTGKDALEYPSSSNLRTEKDVLDNQRVVTIRQPTRDNWTSHKTRKACDGAATPEALLVVKEGITEESIDREWQECDKYEEEKFDIQQKVSVLRNPDKEETIPIASEDTVINVKLPELALKSYDGSDRFLYLRQAIVPNSEAYRVVASYPVTGANYALAVQALQERFGDPNILTELYVRRLLNSVISNVKKENRNLSSLYDELSSHLRSLETLGIDPQLSGIFLYPLVESSLPSDILKIWHRHPSSGYGLELAKREESDKGVGGAQERLRLLLDFLKAEVRSAQRLKFVEKGFKQEEPYKRSYNDGTRTRNNFRPATVSSLFGGRTNIKCFFCERTNHASHQCRSIMKMSPGERNDKIRSAHLCFKCLRKGHIQSQCREQLECKNCGRNHLEVLCEGNSSNRLTKPGRENLKENAPEPIASLSSQACTGQVLLMTTVALLRGPNASRRVRILLDSGSQFSYIKQSLVWSVGIERKGEITIAKSLFGGNKIGEEKHGKFMLELENLGNKRDVIHIEALDQRKICDAIPPLPKGDWLEKLKIKGIILSQDNFKGQEIDILIGANYLGMILTGKIVQVEADLTAVETKLGWTLMGNSPIIDSNDNVQQTLNLLTTRCDLKDLWDLEVLGIRDPVETCSKETRYQEIKEKFKTKIQRQSDQRYSVGLPWKVEKESIPSNLDIAIKRLDISTKKMTSQNKLTEYSQIFRDWLTEGLIERVEENPLERRGYYLPHRPVYKMESKTTPIRPVFDASCLGHNGLSLNQCLEKGPNLLERIPEMMIRFRENKFGVTADIRKAFQMVAIEESERNYLRFLWWEEESDRELIAYRHKRLVFGLNCSPFVLKAVIEYHLQSIRGPLVQWAKILAQSFYMDNCITSLETKQEVQEFQKAAIEIMDRAKMDLREWEYSLEENPEKGTCTKILGVVWNKMEDSLKCELPDNLSIQPKLTKRLVLSMVQRIFDPLGFCAPVFLPPKLLLQRSWGLKLGWDTPLPEGMAQGFRTWLDQIKLIELIKIPRYMWNDLIFPTEVHIFCDASQIGYGAVAYLRSETGRENTLTLIWSKVRLAPMKSITIPRLELMAMVLGARLANAIQAALKRKCETTLWSDSTTALSWIKREIEWRVFVRNRVREIQATTNLNDWRFVPSQLNPADLLSRGCPPSQFVQSRWWEGPKWLKKPKEFWPNSEFSINPKEIKVEENIMKTNNDLKPLTPNEFLQNGPESSFPEFENLKPEMLHTRYRELGQLKRELKQRFLKEYLGALVQKSENIDRRQLKVGDVVLIGQENLKRMFWPKGRIVNLIPGKDGMVRVAHVKTSTGTLIRALQRLHPLEISSNVETIQMDNSDTEPQSDAFLGNRPNIESRDSRNRYGGADTPRKSYKQRLVDGTTSKKIPRAESRGRKDVEENPTSRVSWTGKDALEYPSSSNLRTEKDVLDNQRVVTIRQPTRDNWTSHKTRKACDGAATPEVILLDRRLRILALHKTTIGVSPGHWNHHWGVAWTLESPLGCRLGIRTTIGVSPGHWNHHWGVAWTLESPLGCRLGIGITIGVSPGHWNHHWGVAWALEPPLGCRLDIGITIGVSPGHWNHHWGVAWTLESPLGCRLGIGITIGCRLGIGITIGVSPG
ncbi:hypothetical protein LAZ67_1007617 [Cordylochernes scorpioides]|uniref:CCHC-type domain-containing protein n=1 Tax=Cordylochernes scorpioides TaxID=51811 RepID=A0ABY6K074_9ARAC|nr:hypothetical protein LAZ67_1007617 [Cordylochernes scorpioides]